MDNPYAFPVPAHGYHSIDRNSGMTLRDWFAGQALSVLAAHTSSIEDPEPEKVAKIVAKAAYLLADAMLTERNRNAD